MSTAAIPDASTFAGFVALTAATRSAQDAYYEARRRGYPAKDELNTARILERRLDHAIKAYRDRETTPQLPGME